LRVERNYMPVSDCTKLDRYSYRPDADGTVSVIPGVRAKSKNAGGQLHAEAGKQEVDACGAELESWLNQD
jgi:hypothetical protein